MAITQHASVISPTSPIEGDPFTITTKWTTSSGETPASGYLALSFKVVELDVMDGGGSVDADAVVEFGIQFGAGAISWSATTASVGSNAATGECYAEAGLGNVWLGIVTYYLRATIQAGAPGTYDFQTKCVLRNTASSNIFEQDEDWDGALLATRTSATEDVTIVAAPVGDPPVAVIDSDIISGASPLDVAFDGTGSTDDGTIVGYLWDFGDSSTSTSATPTHTFTGPGTYTVTLTVTDDDDLTDSATLDITVSASPPVAVIEASRLSTLPGGEITFDGSTSSDADGTIISYAWEIEQPSPAPTLTGVDTAITAPFTVEGTYTVSLTVTDDDGQTDTATVEVTAAYATVTEAYAGQPIILRKT